MTKLSLLTKTFFDRISNKLCEVLGHRWQYKDYSNYIKSNGDHYDFKASRHCPRCNRYAYFYTEWINESKSKLDYESDYFLLKKIKINQVVYS